MNYLKNVKNLKIIIACGLVVLGLLMCIFPQQSVNIVRYVVGISLCFLGVYSAVMYFYFGKSTPNKVFVIGIASFTFGILILCMQIFVFMIMGFAFGIGFIAYGLIKLNLALDAKNIQDKKWWIELIYAIIYFCLGLTLLILYNEISVLTYITVAGIFLIVAGGFNLLLHFIQNKKLQEENTTTNIIDVE